MNPQYEAHERLCKFIGDMVKENEALKQRIKRLEVAGDAVADRLQQSDYLVDCALADKWTEAKEAKP